MLKLFTSKDCPTCKILKDRLDKNNVKYEALDTGTVDGLAEYTFLNNKNRMSVPMLIKIGIDGDEDVTDAMMEGLS